MDAVLHAIADGHRRTMLETLRDHPATVNELAAVIPIARPGVSRHLRVLREAGLVEARQDAQRRIYSLRPEPLAEVDDWLADYRALWRHRMDALHTEIALTAKHTEEEGPMSDSHSKSGFVGSISAIGDGKGAVRMEDVYDTSAEDLWSALTDPDRLARWIGAVAGRPPRRRHLPRPLHQRLGGTGSGRDLPATRTAAAGDGP